MVDDDDDQRAADAMDNEWCDVVCMPVTSIWNTIRFAIAIHSVINPDAVPKYN